MAKKKIYRTVIRFEILSEDPNATDGMTVEDLHREAMIGNLSGQHLESEVEDEILVGKEAVEAIRNQGSEPEFFGLDENGNEIE